MINGWDEEKMSDLDSELNIAWGPIRSALTDFTMGDVREVMGLGGLDLAKLQEAEEADPGATASRARLLQMIDGIWAKMSPERKKTFLRISAEEILRRRPRRVEALQANLNRLGWQLQDGKLIPADVFDVSELKELPAAAHEDLLKAATRLRDGDLSGTIGSACAAVNSATNEVYAKQGVGDPGDASFQDCVKKSLNAHGVFSNL